MLKRGKIFVVRKTWGVRILNYKAAGYVVSKVLDLDPGNLGLVLVQKLIGCVTLDKSLCFS